MNASKFDEIVNKRAHQRTQEKITKFKRDVIDALKELTGGKFNNYGGAHWGSVKYEKPFIAILQIMCSDDNTKGWPSYLWDAERAAVTAELMKIMDEMQKALLAPEAKDSDNMPSKLEVVAQP